MHASSTDIAAREHFTRAVGASNHPTRPQSDGPQPVPQFRARATPTRRVQPADVGAITALIADALYPLTLGRWLEPDTARRREVLAAVATIHVEHAVSNGQAWTTDDHAATGLWLPYDTDQPARPDDYDQRLAHVCGPTADRVRTLDRLADSHHPVAPHHQHLTMLAVRRARQRDGLGRKLLDHQLVILDAAEVPSYATAVDAVSRELFFRVGYSDYGPPIDLPGGPRLWPMWRQPRPPRHRTSSS